MDVEGAVAIVTGSSSGVGAACARQLAEKGCHVVINYAHNAQGAEATRVACEEFGVETEVVKADVAEDSDCKSLADAAVRKWGRIDVLVNNAGTTKFCDHEDMDALDVEDFLTIYRLNVVAAFEMIRACTPAMRDAGDSL